MCCAAAMVYSSRPYTPLPPPLLPSYSLPEHSLWMYPLTLFLALTVLTGFDETCKPNISKLRAVERVILEEKNKRTEEKKKQKLLLERVPKGEDPNLSVEEMARESTQTHARTSLHPPSHVFTHRPVILTSVRVLHPSPCSPVLPPLFSSISCRLVWCQVLLAGSCRLCSLLERWLSTGSQEVRACGWWAPSVKFDDESVDQGRLDHARNKEQHQHPYTPLPF